MDIVCFSKTFSLIFYKMCPNLYFFSKCLYKPLYLNHFLLGGEAKIFVEFAAGSRGEMERDRTAAADRVRDQALRSGVHLG